MVQFVFVKDNIFSGTTETRLSRKAVCSAFPRAQSAGKQLLLKGWQDAVNPFQFNPDFLFAESFASGQFCPGQKVGPLLRAADSAHFPAAQFLLLCGPI